MEDVFDQQSPLSAFFEVLKTFESQPPEAPRLKAQPCHGAPVTRVYTYIYIPILVYHAAMAIDLQGRKDAPSKIAKTGSSTRLPSKLVSMSVNVIHGPSYRSKDLQLNSNGT